MILPKPTRKQLYSGKPMRIRWPANTCEPKVDHIYSVQPAVGKPGIISIRVLEIGKATVLVKLEGDPVRLLGKQGGYTDYGDRALGSRGEHDRIVEIEPEAVDPSEIEHYRKSKE